MADAFQKFKNSVNRGITTISVKTSSSFEKNKLKTHIDSLEREAQRLTAALGQACYATYLSAPDTIPQLAAQCEQLRQKYAEIDNLRKELASIDERDNQILGKQQSKGSAPGQTPGPTPGFTPGQAQGFAPGQNPGPAPGFDPGQAQGFAPGQDPGFAPGFDPGQAQGSAPGPFGQAPAGEAEQPAPGTVRYCPGCGAAYAPPAKFCALCGYNLQESTGRE